MWSGAPSIWTTSNCRQPASSATEWLASSCARARKASMQSGLTTNSGITTKAAGFPGWDMAPILPCSRRPGRRGRSGPLHLASHIDHVEVAVQFDVIERDHSILRHGPLQLDIVSQADRQRTCRKALRRRNGVGPHGKAPFAVEHFAGLEVPLGRRDGVSAELGRSSCRLVAQYRRKHAHAGLEADQVEGAPHRPVPAGLVDQQTVLLEAVSRILVVRLERDEDAVTDVVEHLAAVGLLAGSDVDQSAPWQASAVRHGFEHAGEIVKTGRWEGETVVRAVEAGPVGN